MNIEIKNAYGKVLYTAEISDDVPEWYRTRDALVQAVSTGARLTDADLTGADLTRADLTRARLTDADLTGADLTDADLTRADLTRADLTGADLTGADLTDARLTRADLTDADLTRADLTGADLTDADLTDARLTDADLTDARLTGADLRPVKADLWMTLTQNRHEVRGLRAALIAGKIDGSQYSGTCACLVGTLANVRGCYFADLEHDCDNPAERWFMAIRPGHTPESSSVAALTLTWIDEWLVLNEMTEEKKPAAA